MYKINDYVVHIHDVCKIKEIITDKENNITYYNMVPIDDTSLLIKVPIDNKVKNIRDIITFDDANKLISNIPNIDVLDNYIDRDIEKIYKEFLQSGKYEDLIKIIKISYLRNDKRISNNKKASEKDSKYFNLAEKYLYNELSIALNMTCQETKDYIIKVVEKNVNA